MEEPETGVLFLRMYVEQTSLSVTGANIIWAALQVLPPSLST